MVAGRSEALARSVGLEVLLLWRRSSYLRVALGDSGSRRAYDRGGNRENPGRRRERGRALRTKRCRDLRTESAFSCDCSFVVRSNFHFESLRNLLIAPRITREMA